jgi:hypothetical protein
MPISNENYDNFKLFSRLPGGLRVLRRSLESAQYTSIEFGEVVSQFVGKWAAALGPRGGIGFMHEYAEVVWLSNGFGSVS